MSQDEIRNQLKDLLKEYYRLQQQQNKFVPGESKVQYSGAVFDEAEVTAIMESVLDGWFGVGRHTQRMESALADYLEMDYAVLTNSGSSANLLVFAALCFLGRPECLRPGDEVIVPATTFSTVFNPIIQHQLVPVVVDVDVETLNINPDALEKAVSDRTRAIMVLHNLGNPCPMDRIMELAEKHHLIVIEDNCDALGAEYEGKKTGSFGKFSTFSFYPAHHITMGEGGAVCTRDEELAFLLRSLRDWGRACSCPVCSIALNPNSRCDKRFSEKWGILPTGYDTKYVYATVGYNLKPLELQAAMGMVQLGRLPEFIRMRRENFKQLYEFFSQYTEYFILPRSLEKSNPSWFAFPLTIRDGAPFFRQEMIKFLEDSNIESRLIFAGNIIRHPAYQGIKYRVSGNLAVADKIMKDSFFVGVYPGIDDQQIAYLKEKFSEFLDKL
jgi:CDP-6-deoxy-D-xylo-4-hexulose-3-dehydrase